MLWFDADLKCGDVWDEKVKNLIHHPNCKGTIFFNSKSAFASDAVQKERCAIKEKIEQGQTFEIFPISIGQRKTIELVKEMLESFSYSEAAAKAEDLSKKIQTVFELFKDSTTFIFADKEAEQDYRQKLFEAISDKLPKVVSKTKFKLNELKGHGGTSNVGDLLCVDFGFAKKRITHNITGSRLKQGNRIFVFEEEPFMLCNEVAYTVKPLEWLCLYCENDTVTMITKDIIDKQKGGEFLDQWLKDVFFASSFTEEQKQSITQLGLLSEKDMELSENDSYLKLDEPEDTGTKWWIKSTVKQSTQKAVKANGTIYENGYNVRIMELGVRPVIKVKLDAIFASAENN